jgi:hypothetical protein
MVILDKLLLFAGPEQHKIVAHTLAHPAAKAIEANPSRRNGFPPSLDDPPALQRLETAKTLEATKRHEEAQMPKGSAFLTFLVPLCGRL